MDSAPPETPAALASAAPVGAPGELPGMRESEIRGLFSELLENLSPEFKHILLIQALEMGGPGVLEGQEAARDAILYAASRCVRGGWITAPCAAGRVARRGAGAVELCSSAVCWPGARRSGGSVSELSELRRHPARCASNCQAGAVMLLRMRAPG